MQEGIALLEAERPIGLGWPEPYGTEGVRRRIAKMSALHALGGQRLLDVGCGNGSYTTAMADHFDYVYGIEIETERLDAFREQLRSRPDAAKFDVAEMSAEALSFADDFFDVVTAIEVIEHIVDLQLAAREIHRVLRPGGVFAITAPNRWFPVETHSFKIRGKEIPSKKWPFVPWVPPLHRRIATARNFRPSDLRQLLEPVGFQQVGTDFMMPPFERHKRAQRLRPLTEWLDGNWGRNFGVSVVAVFRK